MVVGVKVSGVVSFPSYGRCSGAAGLGCEGGRRAGAGPLYVLRFSARRSARAVCPGRYLRRVRSPFSQGFAASA